MYFKIFFKIQEDLDKRCKKYALYREPAPYAASNDNYFGIPFHILNIWVWISSQREQL